MHAARSIREGLNMHFKTQLAIAVLVSLLPAAASAETSIVTKIGRYVGWGISDGYHVGRCCATTCSACEGTAKRAYLVPTAEPILAPPRQNLPEPIPTPQTMGWLRYPTAAPQMSPVPRPMPVRFVATPVPVAVPMYQQPVYQPAIMPYHIQQPTPFVPASKAYKPVTF